MPGKWLLSWNHSENPSNFYEYTEGGHSAGVTNKEVAFESA